MTRKVIRGLFVLAGLLAVIGLAYLYALLTGGFEVPRLAKLSNCESRLRIIATAIYGLGEEHYYIPRDGRSEFTPSQLICQVDDAEHCIVKASARCSLKSARDLDWDGWIWCRNLTESEFETFIPGHPGSKPFVVVCHDPDCLHYLSGKYYAPILTSHGVLEGLEVDVDEYRHWVDTDFRKGNLAIPSFMLNRIEKLRDSGE